jgi:[protein-PII] uridylyltransferase
MSFRLTSAEFSVDRLSAHKTHVAGIRDRARSLFDGGATGIQVAASISEATDELLVTLYEQSLATLHPALQSSINDHAAVIAIGGTGRGELAPYSDVDLLFLYDSSIRDLFSHSAGQVVRDCWDAGIELGHSIRTIAETVSLARREPEVATALVEARLLCGNPSLFEKFQRKVSRQVIRGRLTHFIDDCLRARNEERAKHGGSITCLEPDVKRSLGGLRDLHLIRWIGFARFGTPDIDSLGRQALLSKEDARMLLAAHDFLLRIRIDMHFAAGRANDFLSRDEQLRIAEKRGIEGTAGQRPVERFMQSYFRQSTAITDIAGRFVRAHRPRRFGSRLVRFLKTHRTDGVLKVGSDYLDALPSFRDQVCGSSEQVLQLYVTATLYSVTPSQKLADCIKRAVSNFAADQPLSETAARLFLKILEHSGHLGPTLRSMYDTGLLELIVPEMSHVRCLLQFNQYHSYTVDEHSFRAVEAAEELAQQNNPVGVACRGIHNKDILHLALLLHDLGKGFDEDHSEVGRRIAEQTAVRLRLSDDQREMLVFLVHRHLRMSHLGLRRDTTEPEVLLPFTHEVGSPELLRMLYVLTVADLTAVGPDVWTAWKADLLAGFYNRAMRILSGKPYRYLEDERLQTIKQHVRAAIVPLETDTEDELSEWIDRQTAAFSPHYLMSTPPERIAADLDSIHHLQPGEVIVEGRNEPETGTVEYRVIAGADLAEGCFHKLAGVLTAKRLEILTAQICTTTEGTVVDRFRVIDDDFAGVVPQERIDDVAAAIRATLTKKTEPEHLFQRHLPFGAGRDVPSISDLPTRVVIDNDSSDNSTIIDVFAHDRPGLLYTISRSVFEQGLSVTLAKIATHFDQVVDVFYVTDAAGKKIVDEERLREIRACLESTIHEFERKGYLLFAS